MSYGYPTTYGGVTGTPGMQRSPGVPMFNPGQLDAFRAKLKTLGIDDQDSPLNFLDQGAELKQQPYLMKQDLRTMGYGALTGTDVSQQLRSMAFKPKEDPYSTQSMFKNGAPGAAEGGGDIPNAGMGAAEGGGDIPMGQAPSGAGGFSGGDMLMMGGGNPKTKAAIGAMAGL